MTLSLDKLRSRITILDEQLVQLLSERMQLSRQIGQYKKEHNLPLVDEQREKNVLIHITSLPHEGIEKNDLIRLYEVMIQISRNIQME